MTCNSPNGKAVNWDFVEENGAKPKDPVDALIDTGKDLVDEYEAAIDRAIEKSKAIREAEANGTADIKIRHEGLRRRENAVDRKRYEARKANRDREILTAHHLNDLGGFAVNGEKFVLDVVAHLTEVTDDLSADLQPIGEMLTKVSTKILSSSYAECLKFLAERGFQEIDQATKPGQQ